MATRQEKKGREGATIEEMAEAIRSAMPRLDATEQRIAIAAYRLLAEGEPVTSDDRRQDVVCVVCAGHPLHSGLAREDSERRSNGPGYGSAGVPGG